MTQNRNTGAAFFGMGGRNPSDSLAGFIGIGTWRRQREERDDQMPQTKKFFYHRIGEHQLFYKLYYPIENEGKYLVFCYPWAEERIRAHRIYENFAAILMSQGYGVLQFDYRGYGDSSGQFQEATLDTYLEDISNAIDYILENFAVTTLGLFGLRFGATLVSLLSDSDTRINYQVLWDPIIDVRGYIYEKLRSNIASQMSAYRKVIMDRDKLLGRVKAGHSVDVEGYPLSKGFFDSIKEINLINKEKTFPGRVLLLGVSKPNHSLKVSSHLRRLHDLYKTSSAKADLIVGQAHPFWDLLRNFYPVAEDLYKKSLRWMEENIE